MKLTWSRGPRASRATSIASFLGCCQDVGIIWRNYHSRSSVVRDDEAIELWQETEEIWAKIRISRVARASEIRKQSFPGSWRCRCRLGLLKLPTATHSRVVVDPWTHYSQVIQLLWFFTTREFIIRFVRLERMDKWALRVHCIDNPQSVKSILCILGNELRDYVAT